MKDKLILMALSIMLLNSIHSLAQERIHAVEFGMGGSAFNHTRTVLSDFHQTPGGDYVFKLEEKILYGGTDFYAAYELNPWLFIDAHGSLGFARYHDSGSLKQGFSILAGPGLQIRPALGNEWVQPYFRIGANYYHKNFPTAFWGSFEGDVTREGIWKAEDSWNKGSTFDTDTYFPLSAGLGLIGWISNRVGIRIEGNYLRSIGSKGANFAQGTAGLVLRLGGNDKHSSYEKPVTIENVVEREVVKEVVKEVPVETVREVYKEIPADRTLSSLMDNVTFDFDKAELTEGSKAVLDEVAGIIAMFPEDRFLISGHTDARGSETYNEQLSTDRARAVFDALVERGIPESRLCYRGFGKKTAVVPGSEADEIRRGDRKVVLERITWDPLWQYLKNNQ